MTLDRFLDSLNVEYLLRAFDGRLAQLATAAGSRVSRAGVGGDIFPQPARRVRLETPALRGLRNPCSYDFPKHHDYFNQIAHWDQKKMGFKEQKLHSHY